MVERKTKTLLGVEVEPKISWGNIASMVTMAISASGIVWTVAVWSSNLSNETKRVEQETKAEVSRLERESKAEIARLEGRATDARTRTENRFETLRQELAQGEQHRREQAALQTQVAKLAADRVTDQYNEQLARSKEIAEGQRRLEELLTTVRIQIGAPPPVAGVRPGPR